jgi:hypothetical protein
MSGRMEALSPAGVLPVRFELEPAAGLTGPRGRDSGQIGVPLAGDSEPPGTDGSAHPVSPGNPLGQPPSEFRPQTEVCCSSALRGGL